MGRGVSTEDPTSQCARGWVPVSGPILSGDRTQGGQAMAGGAETPGSWVGTPSPPRPVRRRPQQTSIPPNLPSVTGRASAGRGSRPAVPKPPRPIPEFPEDTGVPPNLVCIGGPQRSAQSKVLIYGAWEL